MFGGIQSTNLGGGSCLQAPLSLPAWYWVENMRNSTVIQKLTQVNTPRLNPSLRPVAYSIYVPWRDGRLSSPRWLVTYRDGQTVTHPSTNPTTHCRESNPRPVDHRSDALTTTPPSQEDSRLPCPGCAAVATVTSEGCREGVPPPALDNATSGYLASVLLSDTPSCNDGRQTWTIRADPGQQISLKLYDFYADQPKAAPSAWRQLNRTTNSLGTGWSILSK